MKQTLVMAICILLFASPALAQPATPAGELLPADEDLGPEWVELPYTFPTADSAYPEARGWYAGPDGSNISQKSNGWSGQNITRYQNPEYDRLFDELSKTTDAEAAASLFIQLNDIVINDFIEVPLVQ